MADTVRHSIMDNLLTRFQAISEANGYANDYNYIGEWRLYPLDAENELPAIVIADGEAVVANPENEVMSDYEMEFTVSFFVASSTAAATMRSMIQDAYACIKADPTCGGYAEDVKPVSETISMQMKDNVYGDIDVKFKVLFTTGYFDPTKNYN